VVGSGIAGLCAALDAAPRARVALLTKGSLDDGCSRWAQGGIAAALGDDDSSEQHYQDTVAAGRGLCHPEAVRVLVEEGPARIRQLVDWGVGFDTQDGRLLLAREAAHSRARVVHARGDGTGLEVETALIARLRKTDVTVVEHAHVDRLLVDAMGRCAGVDWWDVARGVEHRFTAPAVLLATGGAARLWPNSTNPASATGDGVALAFAVGAEVAGMEFVQFHPTALAVEGAPRFLISEAMRGEGAVVVNASGRRFLFDADSRGELAGRDVVSRAIWDELRDSGSSQVYLDCSRVDSVSTRFPAIHRMCAEHGIDIARELVPIAPAAHYVIGGVRSDLCGATSVAGLYACGEVASSGVHGANRLASNSLLESLVFGHRAAVSALHDTAEAPRTTVAEPVLDVAAGTDDADAWQRMSAALWEGAGIVRSASGLQQALDVCREAAVAGAATRSGRRLEAAATTASLVCEAALRREETRGCHIRSDHPRSSDEWHGDLVMHSHRGAQLDHHI